MALYLVTGGAGFIGLNIVEDFNPRPISPYGVSKLAAENYCNTFSATFGLETVSLRDFTYVYNVACGNFVPILDIVEMLNKLLGKNLSPKFTPKRAGDVRKSYADITSLRDKLGMKKLIDFDEGLKKTVEWFIKNKESLLKI